ncbi:HipA domain-containing protein [Fusobacterium necrophorum]|uniref:hypothetical protein n=1 Tax=Fusobacterium necrophorum TaxID=859 RepID=UPI000B08B5D0|nr:hypothetical protein [Fusobacterium necrophorum]
MIDDKYEKEYCLKLKDEELLTFNFSVEKQPDGEVNNFLLKDINKKNQKLFPLNLEVNSSGIQKWIETRKAPKNRNLIDKVFEKIAKSKKNVMDYIDVSFGLSLNDCYWIIPSDKKDEYKWEKYNLYKNKFSEVIGNIAFTGYGEKITGVTTSPEMTTNGMLKKCWHIENEKIYLYKGSTQEFANQGKEAYSEFYSSQVAKIFFGNIKSEKELSYTNYSLKEFHNQIVSSCELFTTEDKGYIPIEMVLKNKGIVFNSLDTKIIPEIKKIYGTENFEDLMVFDAIIGNTDRHLGNFGMFIDNNTNKILEPAPIFDNGLSFLNNLTLEEIKDKNYIKEYNNKITNRFNQSFEEVIKLYVNERHLESLEKLKDFSLEKDKNYNLSDDWLKGFENNIKENAKNFIEIFKEKELEKEITKLAETLDINLLEEIGVDKVNEIVVNRVLESQNFDLKVTKELISSIKEGLKIQKLLIDNNLNTLCKEEFYEIVDCFLESQNTKDMKTVFAYLEKNDFPIDYVDHFKEKFRLEIEKITENKEKSNNSKEINDDEKVEKKKEFDISDKF